jgi:hypothetical protein
MGKKRRAQAALVVAVGDLHINSTVGLSPPRVQLDDGGTFTHSKEQAWIWDCWQRFWEQVNKQRESREIVAVLNGDLVEGNHHHVTALISHNETTQALMALEILEPVAAMADRLYVIRGTEAHTGQAAYWEELIASDLGAQREKGGGASYWQLCLVAGGVKFDAQHHPSTAGYTYHTRVSAPGREARSVRTGYQEDGLQPPDVVLRSHTHHFDRGWAEGTECLYLPGWQLTTAFAHRRGAGRRIEPVGGVLFDCADGAYTVTPIRYRPERRDPWQ